MGTIATAVTIAQRDGPSISCPNHGQSSEDEGDGQMVHKYHNLLPLKGAMDHFEQHLATHGSGKAKNGQTCSVTTHYYIPINTRRTPEAFKFILNTYPSIVGWGPSVWESVTYASHLFNCKAYGKYVSLLGGEIILGYDFKTFTQF